MKTEALGEVKLLLFQKLLALLILIRINKTGIMFQFSYFLQHRATDTQININNRCHHL